MQESVKRIRLEMTFSGLNFMLASGISLSRKDIFSLDRPPVDASKRTLFFKEHSSKTWQTSTLDRMVKAGLIEREEDSQHQFKYKIIDRNRCNNILDDYERDGVMLAHYLFPSEVAEPKFADVIALAVANKKAPEPPAIVDGEIALGTLIQTLATNIADMKDHQHISFARLIDGLDLFNKGINALSVDVNKNIESQVGGVLRKIDQRMDSVSKHLESLEKITGNLVKIIESNQAATKRVNESIETVITANNKVRELLECINNADARTISLQKSVEGLVAKLEAKDNDRLGDLIRAFKKNADEQDKLAQMLLDIAAEKT